MTQLPSEPANFEHDPLPEVVLVEYRPTPQILADGQTALQTALQNKSTGRGPWWWLMFTIALIILVIFVNNAQNSTPTIQPQNLNTPPQSTLSYFVAWMPAALILLGVWVYVFLRTRSVRNRNKQLEKVSLLRWRLRESGIGVFIGDLSTTEWAWKGLVKATAFKTGYLVTCSTNENLWISSKGFKDITHERQVALRLKRHISACVGFTVLQCKDCNYDISQTILDGKSTCPECGRDVAET